MVRPIVVPLDRSAFAEHALSCAVDLARQLTTPLHLVHVQQFPRPKPVAPDMVEVATLSGAALRAEAVRDLEGMAAMLAEGRQLDVQTFVLDGPVVTTIGGHVTAHDARLVVMSTHGRGGIARLVLGSVADRLTRELHCPILLLRPGAADGTTHLGLPRRVLVPLDGSHLAEAVLDQLLAIFGGNETELLLLRVVSLPLAASPMGEGVILPQALVADHLAEANAYLQRIATRLRDRGLTVVTACRVAEAVATEVIELAGEWRPDVIAMATRGRHAFERAVLGSVADTVLRRSVVPVLLWNPPASGASSALVG